MDRVDMHVHTTASDGAMSPRDVTSLAAMQGLKAIALTDRDTMAGIPEAGEAGALLGVTIIPGIEISSDYKGRAVEILGYFLDSEDRKLLDYEAWVLERRRERLMKMAEKLRHKGFDVSTEAEHPGVPDRSDLAGQLVELGVADSVQEAFRRYLGEGRSCYVPRERIPFADAAKLIRDCGGAAVLAHPLQYGFPGSELDALVKTAAAEKFSGMEILYPGYTRSDQDKLYSLAEKYMLLPTGGSGFRGGDRQDRLGEPQVPAYMLIMLAQSQYR